MQKFEKFGKFASLKSWDSTPTGTHTTCLHVNIIIPAGVLDPARSAAAARRDADLLSNGTFYKFPLRFQKVFEKFLRSFPDNCKSFQGFPKLLSNVGKAFPIRRGACKLNPKFSTQTFVGFVYNCLVFFG